MAMGTEVGDAYIEVHADTKGLSREIKRGAKSSGNDFAAQFSAAVADGIDMAEFNDRLDKTFNDQERKSGKSGERSGSNYSRGFSRGAFSRMDGTVRLVLGLIASIGPQMAALGSALSAQVVAILSSALVGLAGSLIALAGPLAVVVTGVIMTVKSFSDMRKSVAGLEGSIKGLSSMWKEQSAAFSSSFGPALTNLFGSLSTALSGSNFGAAIGGALAQIAEAFTAVVNSPGFAAFLQAFQTVFPAAAAAFGQGLAGLTQGLLTLFAAAGPAAVELGKAFASWGQSFADAMSAMADSGQLATFFDTAVASLDALLGLVNPLAQALGNVFLIGSESGNTMLSTLGGLAQQFLAFTQSAEGSAAIGTWFSQSIPVFNALIDLVGSLGSTLATMVTPGVLAGVVGFIESLSGFVPVLGGILSAIGNIGILQIVGDALTAIGTALQPVLPALAQLGASLGANLGSIITALQPALNALAGVIGIVAQALGPLISQLVDALMPVFAALTPIITMVGQILQGLAPVVGALISAFAPVIQTVAEVAVQLAGALMPIIMALLPIIQKLAPTIVSLFVAFNPVLRVVTLLLPVLMPVVDILSKLVVWVLELITPLADFANKIGVVVAEFLGFNKIFAGIGALLGKVGSWFSGVGESAGGVGKRITAVWNMVKSVTTTVWNAVVNAVRGPITAIGNVVRSAFAAVKTVIEFYLNAVRATITAVWTAIRTVFEFYINAIRAVVTTVFNAIRTVVTTVFNAIRTTITTVLNAIKNVVSRVWEGIKAVFQLYITGIRIYVTTVFNIIKTVITTVINAVKAVITRVWTGIKTITTTVFNGIKTTITSVWNTIRTGVISVVNTIKSVIASAWSTIKSTSSTTWQAIRDTITGIVTGLSDGVRDGIDAIVKWFKGIKQKVLDTLSGAATWLVDIGKDVLAGFAKGLTDAVSAVTDTVKNIGNKVVKGFKDVFKISSPSKVMIDIGKDLTAGLAVGMGSTASLKDLESAVKKISSTLTETLEDAIDERANQLIAARKAENEVIRRWNASRPKGTRARASLPSLNLTEARKLVETEMGGTIRTIAGMQKELTRQSKRTRLSFNGIMNAISTNPKTLGKIRKGWVSERATLGDIARAREVVAGRLEAANKKLAEAIKARTDFADQIAASARAYGSAMNAVQTLEEGQKLTSDSVVAEMTNRLAEITKFNAQIVKLKKAGLNDTTLREIVEGGVEDGGALADALVEGGADAVTKINGLQSKLNTQAKTLGTTTAGYFYDAGVESAKGLVEGLESQDKALAAAMKTLAEKLLTQFKKTLGIKSPARAFIDPGVQVAAGIAKGVMQGRGKVDNALAQVTSGSLSVPNVRGGGSMSGAGGAPWIASTSTSGSRSLTVAPGAVVVHAATEDPAQVANAVLDRLVARYK